MTEPFVISRVFDALRARVWKAWTEVERLKQWFSPKGFTVLAASDTLVMASDGMAGGKPEFKGFSLSVNAATEEEADKLFAALGKGGQVQMPQAKTFFSPRFGMVADRFGVSWMVIVLPKG